MAVCLFLYVLAKKYIEPAPYSVILWVLSNQNGCKGNSNSLKVEQRCDQNQDTHTHDEVWETLP